MSARNILVFVFFGCLAAIAYLIPQSVKVLRGDGSNIFDKKAPVKQEAVVATPGPTSPTGKTGAQSPLDRVLTKIETGAYDSKQKFESVPRRVKVGFWDKLLGRGDAVPSSSPTSKDPNLQALKDIEALSKVFSQSQPLDWAQVNAANLKPIYKRGIKRIMGIQKMLGKEYPASRSKLQTYIDAVQKFSDGSYQKFSVEESLRYLATVDMDVSKTMASERVRRDILQAWQRIGLDPLLRESDAKEIRQRIIPPFRASVLVIGVKAQDLIRRAPGVQPFRLKTELAVTAAIIGLDVTKYQVFRGKELIKEGSIKRGNNKEQNRTINFRQSGKGSDNVLSGTYTVVISDGFGNVHSKRYRFYPQVKRFKQSESGHFAIPGLNKLSSDSLLDRLFHVGASNSFFSTLSDSSIDSGGDGGSYDDLDDGAGLGGF